MYLVVRSCPPAHTGEGAFETQDTFNSSPTDTHKHTQGTVIMKLTRSQSLDNMEPRLAEGSVIYWVEINEPADSLLELQSVYIVAVCLCLV
jgi:hypothetical protein